MELKTEKHDMKPTKGIIRVSVPVKEKVSLRKRIEVLEEDLYKLKEAISPLEREIEKIKDFIGISN